MMLRSWTNANYLGHKNLKDALDKVKRGIENVVLSAPALTVYPDGVTTAAAGGLGGYLRVGGTFLYRIEDVAYLKSTGITQAVNSGDKSCQLIPGNRGTANADQTATGGYDVTATYYRAGVLLIDSSGNFSVKMASVEAGKSLGISEGGRLGALRNLLNELESSDIADKAIVCFYVIGDGTNAFVNTTSLTISTNLDLYQLGGMALSTGQSTDGGQMLGIL